MRQVWVTAFLATGVVLYASPAGAGLLPATASFFTAPADGELTFTYEGWSALDIDQMTFASTGNTLFANHAAGLGAVVRQTVVAGTYQIIMRDSSTGYTWSSDPASNQDNMAHLAATSTFSDFHLGSTAPLPVSTNCALLSGCYLGWEDRLQPGVDRDFNDLVFALQFTPASRRVEKLDPIPVPEPDILTSLCACLLGLGLVAHRRT